MELFPQVISDVQEQQMQTLKLVEEWTWLYTLSYVSLENSVRRYISWCIHVVILTFKSLTLQVRIVQNWTLTEEHHL